MNNKEKEFLNFRGKSRQFVSKLGHYAKNKGKQSFMILGALIVLFLIFTITNVNFASKYNVLSMAQSLAPYAVLALGVTFVISTGGIDLSIGTVCIASAVLGGKVYLETGNLSLALPIMVAVGLVFGIINGILVAKLRLPPFIATLGTMMFARGLSAIVVSKPNIIFPNGSWLNTIFSNNNGFPMGLVWVLGLFAICLYLMYKCKIGRYILAIGSNEEASRLSGIKTSRYKMLAYIIAGLFAGIASIFWAASFPTVAAGTGNGMELDAIAGVYIGGTSASGGIASVLGSLLGSMILVVIRSGLNFALAKFNISVNATYMTYVITGIIVVVAVLLDVVKTRNANRIKTEKDDKKIKKAYAEQLSALKIEKDYALSKITLLKRDEKKGEDVSSKLDEAIEAVESIDESIEKLKSDTKKELELLNTKK